MTGGELVTVEGRLAEWRPPAALTVTDAIEQIDAARRFVAEQLIPTRDGKNGDYGLIPGCGDKPVLFQSGAEKLRVFFKLSPHAERTHYADLGNGECEFAYRCRVATVDGTVVGDRESWAVSTEKTFRGYGGKLTSTKNAISARAQKRAFVAAVRQATGLSDLFTLEDDSRAPEYIDERQQGIVLALLAIAKPELVQAEVSRARKTRTVHWQPYLESALDAIEMDDDARDTILEQLLHDDATAATVADLFKRPDVAQVAEGEVVDA